MGECLDDRSQALGARSNLMITSLDTLAPSVIPTGAENNVLVRAVLRATLWNVGMRLTRCALRLTTGLPVVKHYSPGGIS